MCSLFYWFQRWQTLFIDMAFDFVYGAENLDRVDPEAMEAQLNMLLMGFKTCLNMVYTLVFNMCVLGPVGIRWFSQGLWFYYGLIWFS